MSLVINAFLVGVLRAHWQIWSISIAHPYTTKVREPIHRASEGRSRKPLIECSSRCDLIRPTLFDQPSPPQQDAMFSPGAQPPPSAKVRFLTLLAPSDGETRRSPLGAAGTRARDHVRPTPDRGTSVRDHQGVDGGDPLPPP